MAKKIDPLNKKQYSAVSAMLTVSDIPAALSFYRKALGFSKRAIMNGQTAHHARRVDPARNDFVAWSGKSCVGYPISEKRRRFAGRSLHLCRSEGCSRSLRN